MISPKKIKLAITSTVAAALICTSALAANVTTTASTNVRSGPGSDYPVITVMRSGMTVVELGSTNGWVKVSANGKTGYVSSDYLVDAGDSEVSNSASSSVKQDAITQPSAPSEDFVIPDSGSDIDSSAAKGEQIAEYAKQFLGCKYAYGANGPTSFDCSGLTQYVYANFGISLPRSSSSQYKSCPTIIPKSQLQPGDLMFFSSSVGGSSVGHVGIYIGDGLMIHAANSSRGVVTDSINSTYYTQHYVASGRYY